MTQKMANQHSALNGRFIDCVYEAVRGIPAGQVLTYGQVARHAGSPRAARAVGRALAANPRSFLTDAGSTEAVPCHRVVLSDRRLGQFNGGQAAKQRLLEAEGWRVVHGRLVDQMETR